MKQRLKLKMKCRGAYQDTHVEGQIKLGFFWETVVTVSVTSGRDAQEAVRLAKERLAAYVAAGFDDNGVINL